MTRSEPRWLPRLVVDVIHVDQIRELGGLIGLRDENALESALARPRQRLHYQPETDFAALAAAYAFGLGSNHPFRDANKRVSFLAAVVFLGMNGHDFVAADEEVVQKSVALAAGELGEAELAEWIRSRSLPAALCRRRFASCLFAGAKIRYLVDDVSLGVRQPLAPLLDFLRRRPVPL